MNIEIDQSGKIENTSKNTVVAFSNGKSKSISISAKDKREIQNFFRMAGKPRVFVYRLFAILIFLLIKDNLKKIDQITIDIEYPGWNHQIKDYLLSEIRKVNPNFSKNNIVFKSVGKKSEAHLIAYSTTQRKREPDLKIGSKDILKFILR